MSKQTEYPLTFAEAEQIAKDGGFVESQINPVICYCKNKAGGWCWIMLDGTDNGPSTALLYPDPNPLRNGRWREVPPPSVASTCYLQDYEPGKD